MVHQESLACLCAYLVGFETLDSLLLLLLSEDDERSTVFVECETHLLLSCLFLIETRQLAMNNRQ